MIHYDLNLLSYFESKSWEMIPGDINIYRMSKLFSLLSKSSYQKTVQLSPTNGISTNLAVYDFFKYLILL